MSPERASDEADPLFDPSDGVPLFPDDDISGSLPEMVIDFNESPLEGPERSPSSIEPELALPEDLWPREVTGAVDAVDLELGADTPVGEDWWPKADGVDDVLDERRPTLAPAPVAIGRWPAMRRSLENLHLDRRVAAVALAGIAAAGLLAALATRSSEGGSPERQVVSAGTRPVASVPSPSVPRSTTTTAAMTVPAPEATSVPGEAPTTVVSSGSSPAPSTGAPVATTRAPSSGPSATTSPPPSAAASPSPSPPPAPAPPATQAPATTSAPVFDEPEESPPTTRRPRVTIPDTTAVPNTTSTTKVPLGDG